MNDSTDDTLGDLITAYTTEQCTVIIDAQEPLRAGENVIHTTRVGKAVDNLLVQDPLGKPFREDEQLARLQKSIEDSLAG